MQLRDLLSTADVEFDLRRDGAVEVSELAYDSRAVSPGTLFFCFPGLTSDGHDHAADALASGAVGLVCERELDLDLPQAVVGDARAAMAPVAAAFFGDPTMELTVAGITGTNGKTTTAFLIREVLEAAGIQCGLLGTVKRIVGGAEQEVERTTPEAIDLQRGFREMLDAGDDACAMEVSSHALVLKRADAIHFDVKVFTNLTQDHLDFHTDMEEYFSAKRLLFMAEGGAPVIEVEGQGVVNIDDEYGRRLAGELRTGGAGELVDEACITFSAAGAEADLSARDVRYDATGSRFRCTSPVGELDVEMPLPGAFNVENALAALATAHALGLDLREAAAALRTAEQVPGRFEPIDEGQPYGVLVDYAHTPDSLENVLRAARRLTEGRLISVFGAGGDRDRDKRPKMGRFGGELSDLAVVTSDNPRSEDPGAIIEEVVAGTADCPPGRVVVESDRRAAIALALSEAGDGDLIVIAGKGHEQGQEFEGGRKIPFDDREVAREELRRLAAGTSS
ncbi:MAG: UDP-N-acetylmuramoyl-L-alanyl-D-glutamate--2,6-diaminopimelate ligase [Solirubrobacterales bacterium]|nr:UDP-N-acetylmuramoyl-L-alanyl-D-glutamate--2,6-diaminopimelate ligase [Solirubrobacterales bacterium]